MRSRIVLVVILAGAAGVIYANRGRFSAGERRVGQAAHAGHGDAASATADACPHTMPRDECPFCDPTLIEKLGECRGHGVPEALCWKCNDALVGAFKAQNDWCAEHDAPESLCPICSPDEATGRKSDGATERRSDEATQGGAAPAASMPRSQRPPADDCETGHQLVRLASPAIAQRAGLVLVELTRRPVAITIAGPAEVQYDGNRYARLGSRVPGVVREVRRDLGDIVAAGDTLAVIESAELAAAKADYLQACAGVELYERSAARERGLHERGASTEHDLLEVEAKLAEARVAQLRAAARLRTLGLTDADVERVVATRDMHALLPLAAPFAGVLVEREAVIGEAVETARPLFALADTARMWAIIDLAERDAARVEPGQAVRLTADALPDAAFDGHVTWVSTNIDPKTRTLKVRAEFDNAAGRLRAHMFGRAEIEVRAATDMLLVPRAAVQWDGCCNIVFVRRAAEEFEPRKVQLGAPLGDEFEVLHGVAAGDTVVTTGSFLLKSELLKGELGAGCCPEDAAKKR
jgi:cobalt-zinc-cadmium efflux system membrane fusion protein